MDTQNSSPGSGRHGSRGNAVKHGLTATTLLPAVLDSDSLQRHLERLRDEWRPQTPTQDILVHELARHAAALEMAARAESAVLRSGARAALLVTPSIDGDGLGSVAEDLMMTGAVATEAIERLTRYRRAHEKSFHQTLHSLKEMLRRPEARPVRAEPPFEFTDDGCADYLRSRFHDRAWQCARCGHRRGYWLADRERWQCGRCSFQSGLRTDTVMEHSPLPPATWIRAIWAILDKPEISPRELAPIIGIGRESTARKIRNRIHDALSSPARTTLLAGLDRLWMAGTSPAQEILKSPENP